MRLVDKGLWVVLLIYILSQAFGEFIDGFGHVPVEVAGDRLRLPPNLPVITLEGPGHRRGGSYIGTAFAVGESDDWLTARHVSDGCLDLDLIEYASGRFQSATPVKGNVLHKSADLARLDAAHSSSETFAVLGPRDGLMPEYAWGHGFPQGESAWVEVRFLAQIAVADAKSGTAYGAVWHVDRYPSLPVALDLGGLSGGPLIDSRGRVRGIIVGSDPRRARLVTIDPAYAKSLSDAQPQSGLSSLEDLSAPERDELLKRSGMIKLVNCES